MSTIKERFPHGHFLTINQLAMSQTDVENMHSIGQEYLSRQTSQEESRSVAEEWTKDKDAVKKYRDDLLRYAQPVVLWEQNFGPTDKESSGAFIYQISDKCPKDVFYSVESYKEVFTAALLSQNSNGVTARYSNANHDGHIQMQEASTFFLAEARVQNPHLSQQYNEVEKEAFRENAEKIISGFQYSSNEQTIREFIDKKYPEFKDEFEKTVKIIKQQQEAERQRKSIADAKREQNDKAEKEKYSGNLTRPVTPLLMTSQTLNSIENEYKKMYLHSQSPELVSPRPALYKNISTRSDFDKAFDEAKSKPIKEIDKALGMAKNEAKVAGRISKSMARNPEDMLYAVKKCPSAVYAIPQQDIGKPYAEKLLKANPEVYGGLPEKLREDKSIINLYREEMIKHANQERTEGDGVIISMGMAYDERIPICRPDNTCPKEEFYSPQAYEKIYGELLIGNRSDYKYEIGDPRCSSEHTIVDAKIAFLADARNLNPEMSEEYDKAEKRAFIQYMDKIPDIVGQYLADHKFHDLYSQYQDCKEAQALKQATAHQSRKVPDEIAQKFAFNYLSPQQNQGQQKNNFERNARDFDRGDSRSR